MEDKYFDKKVGMILDIMGLIVLHMRDEGMVEKHKKDIRLILKEIAKDQRHACAEAVLTFSAAIKDDSIVSSIHDEIMNTHIKKG